MIYFRKFLKKIQLAMRFKQGIKFQKKRPLHYTTHK